MRHERFTTKRVNDFVAKGDRQQTIHHDGHTPGLGLRITTAGARSYIFETSLHGRTVRMTIGDPKTWTLKAAQAEATRLKALTDQGIDPRQLKAEQLRAAEDRRRRETIETTLVSEAWKKYILQRTKTWGPRHLRDHLNLSQTGGVAKKRGKELTRPGVLHPILQKHLIEINAGELTKWVTKESETRANGARQGYELFRAFWRWASAQVEYSDVISAEIVEDKELRKQVPRPRTKKHDVLSLDQLNPWFQAVRSLENPIESAYLQGLLLTGARREELAELRWKHVKFRWRWMWLKDKVDPQGRRIPLTPYLAELLDGLPRRNKWVFSSMGSESGHITEPRSPHNRALANAKLEHVSIQGLRRSFQSLAEWVEMPKGIIDQIVGHAPNSVADRHYIFRPIDLLAVWHDRYESWILENAGIRANPQDAKTIKRLSHKAGNLKSIRNTSSASVVHGSHVDRAGVQ
jgi:integrase